MAGIIRDNDEFFQNSSVDPINRKPSDLVASLQHLSEEDLNRNYELINSIEKCGIFEFKNGTQDKKRKMAHFGPDGTGTSIGFFFKTKDFILYRNPNLFVFYEENSSGIKKENIIVKKKDGKEHKVLPSSVLELKSNDQLMSFTDDHT